MSETPQPRLSTAAVVAFGLGLASLGLSVVAALPAMGVGLWAVRAINGSDGRLRGRRLAIAGLVLGGAITLLTALGGAALVFLSLQEKSHLAGCANNLRQTGQAVNRYHDRHDHFPAGTVPHAALPPAERLSWQAAVVPFLSEGRPADKRWEKPAGEIDFRGGWQDPANSGPRQTDVLPYLCPTFARDLSGGRKGLTTYPGIAGVGPDAAGLSLDDPRSGFFGYDRTAARKDITAGISETMTAVETARDNGPWLAGGTPTVRGLDPNDQLYLGPGNAFGGLHRGGANVLWADGSVRFVSEHVSPSAFAAAARIHREEE